MSKFYRWGFVTLAAAAVLAGLAVPAGAVTADPPQSRASAWHCKVESGPAPDDRGGRDAKITCTKQGDGEIEARFYARGEWILMLDGWRHGPVMYLHVDGYGTSRWVTHGAHTEHNLDFPEGRSGWIRLCTSDAPNAQCTTQAIRT